MEHKYCHKCGKKIGINDNYCPNCRASQNTKNKLDSAASGIRDFCGTIGILLGGLGVILIAGSIIGSIMRGPMEDPNVKRVWLIGELIYMLFVMTGFIEISAPLGIAFLVIGIILFKIGGY